MEFKIKIKMELVITEEDIEDIIDTAGYGIGYWAKRAIVGDDYYEVVDEDGVCHKLTYGDICKGINRWYITDGNIPYDIMEFNGNNIGLDTGMIDSEMADMIIQYACFGEIIYG